MSKLGEVWVPGQDSDVSYTGTQAVSPTSVQYFRDKAREFQATLNAVDEIAQVSAEVANALPDGEARDEILMGLQEFESRRLSMKLAAEGINAGAAVINAAGGRFPVLSIPRSLGAPPLLIPAAAAAAFAAAAGLIAWAVSWNRVQTARIDSARRAAESIADPQTRDETLAEIARLQNRAQAALQQSESPLAMLSGAAVWIGAGVAAFFLWKLYKESKS